MAVADFHEFTSCEELAEALAHDVAQRLQPTIETADFASLALSGGGTPKLFLNKLGGLIGEGFEMVYIALVDERFVPPTNERSNERMVRECLGLTDHPASEFLSLYQDNSTVEDVAKRAQARLLDDDELPFNVLTLGMGLDGHTASFFPGGNGLNEATDPNTKSLFQAIHADGADEPRITMTLPVITSAQHIVLHIEGNDKRKVFDEAMKDGDADLLPVRHVLRHPDANVHVYWAP